MPVLQHSACREELRQTPSSEVPDDEMADEHSCCHSGPTGSLAPTSASLTSRSTQPYIPPGSLNSVPASAGVKAGNSPQVTLCDPIWRVISHSGVVKLITNCYNRFT